MGELVYTAAPVMAALEARLKEPTTLAIFDGIVQKYQSNADSVMIRRGRAKVQDHFPCIALEIGRKSEPWGASNYTKDITVNVQVLGMLKVAGSHQDDRISLAVEDYIMEFGETLQGVLNERGKLQYQNIDGNGAAIYDSYAADADYTYLYQGAIRAVKLDWFAKLWLFGDRPHGFSS